MKLKYLLFILSIVLLAAVPAPAAEPVGKRIVLDNGMILLLSEKHEIPMVTVNVAIRAGAIAAPADKPGLASVTASLLTQGTAKRTAQQISNEIDFIGGSLSASGSDDYASASLKVLKKDLRTGLDLLSDVLLHPAFDQKEIDRKVKSMLAEFQRQKEEPAIVASQAFGKLVYGDHPYGETNDDVAAYLPKLTRQDILDFYKTSYGAAETIIAVVGDVTEAEIVPLLNGYFKEWNKTGGSRPKPAAVPVIEKATVKKIDMSVTQASIDIGNIGIMRENPDYYAVIVMNYILGGGGFSSRLMDNIRDNRGLAYDVHSSFPAEKEAGLFQVSIQTKNESANEVITETLKEIRRIQNEPVSDKELADAKAYLTGSFPLRMDTSAKIASLLTAVEFYNLGLDYPQKYPGLINAVIVVVANQKKANLKY
jgi:zinc protease